MFSVAERRGIGGILDADVVVMEGHGTPCPSGIEDDNTMYKITN